MSFTPLQCYPKCSLHFYSIQQLLADGIFSRKYNIEVIFYLRAKFRRMEWQHPTKNFEIGVVVLIREDSTPPARWSLARVKETRPNTEAAYTL